MRDAVICLHNSRDRSFVRLNSITLTVSKKVLIFNELTSSLDSGIRIRHGRQKHKARSKRIHLRVGELFSGSPAHCHLVSL